MANDWACPVCGFKWPTENPQQPRPSQDDVEAGKITRKDFLFLQTCSPDCARKMEAVEADDGE